MVDVTELNRTRQLNDIRIKTTPQMQGPRGEAVDLQFQTWGLTHSERAIGWLLLKGLSI